MSTQRYTEDELQKYFHDASYRRQAPHEGNGHDGPESPRRTPRKTYKGYRGFLYGYLGDEKKVEAAFALSLLTGLVLAGVFGLLFYVLILTSTGNTPTLEQIENPNLDFATVAYTADGRELGRFGRQNRSWVTIEEISPHAINALVATEDHRFRDHWGVDMFRTFSAVGQTIIAKLTGIGDVQGGSTITQQLARNLYNEQIGFDQSPTRKLKEMVTAVQLERRYTKDEIIEMYLNTVPFRYNAYGIEAAAGTFFNKAASELNVVESAALVGMLKANTRYDPVRNPDLSRQRRNVVMSQMIKRGFLSEAFYQENKDLVTPTEFRLTSEVTQSFAPYFAEHVRNWLSEWGEKKNIDIYAAGLVVHTTLDSRIQEMAHAAVETQMTGLQAVVDYEWSRQRGFSAGQELASYLEKEDYEPFAYFWDSKQDLAESFVRETQHYRNLRKRGLEGEAALNQLLGEEAFMDSLRAEKTRLEAGLLAIDPRTGHVKAWVGGRDLATDWFDHIAIAKRQPGSTFKPFVYTMAIDNGYSPNYTFRDERFEYRDPVTRQVWSPRNSGGGYSGEMLTLREGLARSKNTITGQLMINVGASNVAFYARRLGIESPLDEVPALALGTSDVSLLEMTTAYSTLANGGLRNDPTVVTQILDSNGNILYQAHPSPQEALAEETAFTIIDMMRDVVNQGYGTGYRIRWQYKVDGYDFAGKTGTTQNSADGWFMLMHPELVTGSWVGFNDRRVTFRTNWWGQGAHNALFLVGDFMQRLTASPEVGLNKSVTFPQPEEYGLRPEDELDEPVDSTRGRTRRGRVGW